MESSEPKKYPPTAKKLRDLKKKGQFPKTELAQPTLELVVFTLVFIAALYLAFEHINQWIEMMLYADVSIGLSSMMAQLWWAIAGLVGLKLVVTLLNWVVLNKTVVNTEALGFKIEKINPVNGFKNIFGLEAMSRALRKVLELLFLLFLLKYIFDVIGGDLTSLWEMNNQSYFIYHLMMFIGLCSAVFVVFGLCVGSVDYLVERFHFHKKNRMTFTEMKNEMKETEGAPEIKSERRRRMREVMESPMTIGRKPTFAIANPTHILVPICYEPGIDKAPVVLTIRTNSFAKEERQRLAALNVPVIENKPLARALYKTMKIGEAHIPKEFYRDVAVIISTLRKDKKRGK
ncbi:flagellar biosynthesis protein FlhB [Vibrio sp. B181a]|uniref:EscU/YscU/HrcU family type III secretion system export apparatus switch protein n=1 Tax=Vibrio sp. B181a TaxID=2835906 RepID=UPI0025569C30|nr:EscU/YscU/HrcU family type III secretion system export apparatus switch protein [Vibrio sp. B181a]MDK9774304.1 EscU/YscU/HrcU family type III secretion system export apparatus switch protein [Vibrio sp. B181a]